MILYTKKLLIDFDRFLAEAAGIKNRASTKDAPIILIDDIVTSVIKRINRYSNNLTRTPLTTATFVLKLDKSILLKFGITISISSIVEKNRTNKSLSDTVSIDPNNTLSSICELTFDETKMISVPPRAIEIDKNIPIKVSDDIFVLFLVKLISIAKTTQYVNSIIYGDSYGSPSNTPSAIPVKAACPIDSEKNAILFVTTIVPRPPRMGPMNNADSNELITKAYLK